MPTFTPKMPPVGQVPADLIRLGTTAKRPGRPKTVHADRDSPPPDIGAVGVPGDPTEKTISVSTIAGDPAANPDVFETPSLTGGTYGTRKKVKDKLRFATPRTIPPAPDPGHFEEYSKRFHASPDLRLAGDLSSFNPPPDGPKLLQGALPPVRTPGIDVKSVALRASRRAMSDDDGYHTVIKSISDLPKAFDELVSCPSLPCAMTDR